MTDKTLGQLDQLKSDDQNFAVEAVDILLAVATQRGASDLHLHPRADGWETLLRIDGVLSQIAFLDGSGANNPVARLMVLAGLPTYRSSEPMEGRVVWEGSQRDDLSMRLGVYPTVHGPRAVVRFLGRDSTFETIESLGLPGDTTTALSDACRYTDGAILLSGPAGSGKTTTLYAMLRKIAAEHPRRSVMTIEDPVEGLIDAISQSELDPSGGMTLASALRSAVRQDSEVLLVSEIRDPETAEAAFQASLTGHLVFSSLHAIDVAASIRRLAQFGVPVHVIRSGIRTVVCQRLLRKLCDECGGKEPGSDTTQSDCPACLGSGYHGRVPIAQCVTLDGQDPVGESLFEVLEDGGSLAAMRAASANAGGRDLRQKAEDLVSKKVTDMAEVFRVLGRVRA